jgi:2-aminoadipate transaminase
MPLQFASRLDNVETSAIRELFKLLGKPGIISFAGGFPDSAMFDVEGLREASQKALQRSRAARCNTAPPRATSRCARSWPPS